MNPFEKEAYENLLDGKEQYELDLADDLIQEVENDDIENDEEN